MPFAPVKYCLSLDKHTNGPFEVHVARMPVSSGLQPSFAVRLTGWVCATPEAPARPAAWRSESNFTSLLQRRTRRYTVVNQRQSSLDPRDSSLPCLRRPTAEGKPPVA